MEACLSSSLHSHAVSGAVSSAKVLSLSSRVSSLRLTAVSRPAVDRSSRLEIVCAGKDGFIPGEYKEMYEGVENKGPVRLQDLVGVK